jgi:hypothetical protein
MKIIIIISLFFLSMLSFNISAQEVTFSEKHGNNFNFGLGSGGIIEYSGLGQSLTVFHFSYKFNVTKKITFAPTSSFHTYRLKYNWENNKQDYKHTNYYFQKTFIPTDVKDIYYFNQRLIAISDQGFYQTDSSDNAIVNSSSDNDFLGVELFLNFSSGSNIGFTIH